MVGKERRPDLQGKRSKLQQERTENGGRAEGGEPRCKEDGSCDRVAVEASSNRSARAKLIGISFRTTNQIKRMTGLRKKMYERKIVIMDVLDIPLT